MTRVSRVACAEELVAELAVEVTDALVEDEGEAVLEVEDDEGTGVEDVAVVTDEEEDAVVEEETVLEGPAKSAEAPTITAAIAMITTTMMTAVDLAIPTLDLETNKRMTFECRPN
jgi:hypothetical protein